MTMHTDKLSSAVRDELARITHTKADDWFLTMRARQGLETVFKAVAKTHGKGEVVTQAFTCTTAVNPILAAGHIPVYVDASYDTFGLDTARLQVSASTRAIIMQHTFGLENDLKKASALATKHRVLLVEDSAHQLGLMSRDGAGNPSADVSVHSFGVEKLLPTKFGGAAWVNPEMKDKTLRDAIVSEFNGLPVMSRHASGLAKRYRFFNSLLNHTPPFLTSTVRSFLIFVGLFEPAIMPEELAGKSHGKPMKPDIFVLRTMLDGLSKFDAVVKKRRAATKIYLENLPKSLSVPANLPESYAPARFPVLCEDLNEASRMFDVLRQNGHYSGKWYRPVLFPGVTSQKAYNYDAESCPVTEDLSARILNLPTNITPEKAKEIVKCLTQ